MALSPKEFAKQIYASIDAQSRRQDRTFFGKFVEGKLSRDSLRGYYKHLYHECSTFVRLVSLVHAFAEERDQRETLAANFLEEYGKGAPGKDHPFLAMHVGTCFGLTEGEIEGSGLLPEVREAFGRVRQVAMRSFIEGLAVLTTIEFDLPTRHSMMRNTLIHKYKINEKDLEYYMEHMEGGGVKDGALPGYGGDDVHVARQVALLTKYAATDETQAAVLSAIDATFAMRATLVKALDEHFGATA